MTDITIQREQLVPAFDEILPLLDRHYQEIAQDRDLFRMDPDLDKYAAMERAGFVLFVAVRHHGELIGYFVGFVMPHLHYRKNIVCASDVYYIAPEFRRGRLARRMFQCVIDEATALGVDRLMMTCKTAHNHGGLLESIGFSEFERNYTMRLR